MVSSQKTVSYDDKLLDLRITTEYLKSIGKDAKKVLKVFTKKNGILDEVIANETNLKITQIRTILNQLHYYGIVNYDKTRNQESGWFTYTWHMDAQKLKSLLLEHYSEKMEKMIKQTELESERDFFTCKKGCTKLVFEIAAEYNFQCPECGGKTFVVDNSKYLQQMKEEIATVRRELETLKTMY
jgi:transcription initiation factor TFIIE subunit alpha